MNDFDTQQFGGARVTFKTRKRFAWIKLFIDDALLEGTRYKEELNPTSILSFELPVDFNITTPKVTLRLLYRHSWSIHTKTIMVPFRDMVPLIGEGKSEWRRLFGHNCELLVELGRSSGRPYATDQPERERTSDDFPKDQGLRPTTHQILEKCPHFRILVIGKTGAGKSSLINSIFKVGPDNTLADVSHNLPGKANIEVEIKSDSNPQLILHDSLGFEFGETEHYNQVLKFIQDCNKKVNIGDKLHAIWICLEIPVMGGRLLETGVERLLQMKKKGELGNVPVIVVFTKFDLFYNVVRNQLYEQEPSSTQDTMRRAQERLIETLIKPFEKDIGGGVPHVTVSTSQKPDYQNMPRSLIEDTFQAVRAYLDAASLPTAMAQVVNPRVKVEAIIDVGRKQYWRSLASSLRFPSYTLERCLGVLHEDIINVWRFNDPNKLLISTEFRALMANGIDTQVGGGNPNTTLSAGLSMVAALGGIISTLAGPAAPIVIPIAAAFVFAVWAREVYVASQTTLRRLMTYIIDLTIVTQIIFYIVGSNTHPLTRRAIKLAFYAHRNSNTRSHMLVEINNYSKEGIGHTGADTTFNKIRGMIMASAINPDDVMRKMPDIDAFWTQDDEGWEVGSSPTS